LREIDDQSGRSLSRGSVRSVGAAVGSLSPSDFLLGIAGSAYASGRGRGELEDYARWPHSATSSSSVASTPPNECASSAFAFAFPPAYCAALPACATRAAIATTPRASPSGSMSFQSSSSVAACHETSGAT
jgi:hypothetical protein